eukprot:353102-Chlamydomonas_euryale.AAC.1
MGGGGWSGVDLEGMGRGWRWTGVEWGRHLPGATFGGRLGCHPKCSLSASPTVGGKRGWVKLERRGRALAAPRAAPHMPPRAAA